MPQLSVKHQDNDESRELLAAKTKPSEYKTTKRVTFAEPVKVNNVSLSAEEGATEDPAFTSQEQSSIISSVESVHFDD